MNTQDVPCLNSHRNKNKTISLINSVSNPGLTTLLFAINKALLECSPTAVKNAGFSVTNLSCFLLNIFNISGERIQKMTISSQHGLKRLMNGWKFHSVWADVYKRERMSINNVPSSGHLKNRSRYTG